MNAAKKGTAKKAVKSRAKESVAKKKAATGTARKKATASVSSGTRKTKAAASTTLRAKAAAKKKPAAAAKKGARKGKAAAGSQPPPDAITLRKIASRALALALAEAALDKKAERLEIVDISEQVDYADYLVMMSGRSDRQVVAIARGIEEAAEKRGVRAHGLEGVRDGHWVLADFGDVVAHVFLEEARRYYDLEGLWTDAPRIPAPVPALRPDPQP